MHPSGRDNRVRVRLLSGDRRPRSLHALTVIVMIVGIACAPRAEAQSIPSPLSWNDLCAGIRLRGGPLAWDGWGQVRRAYRTYLGQCEDLRLGSDYRAFSNDPPWADGRDASSRLRAFTETRTRATRQMALDMTLIATPLSLLQASDDPKVSSRGAVLATWCERRFLLEQSASDRSISRYTPGALRRVAWPTASDHELVHATLDALEPRLLVLERRRERVFVPTLQAHLDLRDELGTGPDEADVEARQEWEIEASVRRRQVASVLRQIEADFDLAVDTSLQELASSLSPVGRRMLLTIAERRFDNFDTADPRSTLFSLECRIKRARLPAEVTQDLRGRIAQWREIDDRLQLAWFRKGREWIKARREDYADPLPDGERRDDEVAAELADIAAAREQATETLATSIVRTLGDHVAERRVDDEGGDASDAAFLRSLRRSNDALFDGLRPDDGDAVDGWSDIWDYDAEHDGDGAEVDDDPTSPEFAVHDDAWIKPPPSRRSVQELIESLTCNDEIRSTLTTIHEDFLERWMATVEPLRVEVAELASADSDEEAENEPARTIGLLTTRVDALRRQGEALRTQLFDDMKAALPPGCDGPFSWWRLKESLGDRGWMTGHRQLYRLSDERMPAFVRHASVSHAIDAADLGTEERELARMIVLARADELLSVASASDEAEARGALAERLSRSSAWVTRDVLIPGSSNRDSTAARSASQQASEMLRSSTTRLVEIQSSLRDDLAAGLPPQALARIARAEADLADPELRAGDAHYRRLALRVLRLVEDDPERTARAAEAIEEWSVHREALTLRLAALGPAPYAGSAEPIAREAMLHDMWRYWLSFVREQNDEMLLHQFGMIVTPEERVRLPRLPIP